MISCILAVVCGLAVIGADQFTKHLISSSMELGSSKEFLKGFIDIVYIHNTGGAWGILSGKTWILLALTVAVMIICLGLLFRSGRKNPLLFWAMTIIISGGIGNLIDRAFKNGEVVDFLHFEFFPSFPVFNVADIAVVIGAGLLILSFIIDTVKNGKKVPVTEEIDEDVKDNQDI